MADDFKRRQRWRAVEAKRGLQRTIHGLLVASLAGYVLMGVGAANAPLDETESGAGGQSIAETRLALGKWIETQQIISKERNEWQQSKEILASRLELVKKEMTTLDEKISQAESSAAEANAKRNELLAQTEALKTATSQLTDVVTKMESEVRRLYAMVPEPIQAKLQPLFQRIPDESTATRVSIAERFQNVLGILNELNKANNEIAVNFEVRRLADGKPAEVRALYVGLAQGYYVSATGEAGIGWPDEKGWNWESSKQVAPEVLKALEIVQGKQTPAFVPLPVKLK